MLEAHPRSDLLAAFLESLPHKGIWRGSDLVQTLHHHLQFIREMNEPETNVESTHEIRRHKCNSQSTVVSKKSHKHFLFYSTPRIWHNVLSPKCIAASGSAAMRLGVSATPHCISCHGIVTRSSVPALSSTHEAQGSLKTSPQSLRQVFHSGPPSHHKHQSHGLCIPQLHSPHLSTRLLSTVFRTQDQHQ
jgi:hypothetical protein